MQKLLLKSVLFAAPFALFLTMELFILPTEFWTFRVWEAAGSTIGGSGPWYPKLHIEKVETGDRRLPDGPSKKVEWFTDKFGYRNRPPILDRYDIVAIGDSNFVGTFLDQRDTFAETLARECNCSVYNHAYQGPSDFNAYLRQARFEKFPPKLVIYEFRPGYDLHDPKGWYGTLPDKVVADEDGTSLSESEIAAERRRSRIRTQPGRNWLRARLHLAILALPYSTLLPRGQSKTNDELVSEHGDELAAILASYQHRIESHGTHFVTFMIDYDPALITAFQPSLEKAGVASLALPNGPDRASYFQEADSHWTEKGVRAAAKVVAAYIEKQKILDR